MGSDAIGVTPQVRGTAAPHIAGLRNLALRGLTTSYQPNDNDFGFTRRRLDDGHVASQGSSVRYAAMAALGLHRHNLDDQRATLAGITAGELAGRLSERVQMTQDLGDLAVVAWAASETGARDAQRSVAELLERLKSCESLPTVHAAWALTALVAAWDWDITHAPAAELSHRLADSRTTGRALFSHATEGGRFVGCFADQVYPIQALARYSQTTGDDEALESAAACADRICDLQGPAGQWWWHYDSRTDRLLEGYPVYSVHQHGMAPMALHDLRAAGGPDHSDSVDLGMQWLQEPPERDVRLIDAENAAIWRKIARHEFPRKSVRALKAGAARVTPRADLSIFDRVVPPTSVDWECRPYELAWLLYAWSDEQGVRGADPLDR
jgi:hypothetical protein